MKAMSNDDFAASVLAMANVQRPFTPTATYIPEGDCIEFVVAPDDHYAERIDGLVTVYYSRKTHEIIGSLIKGVRAFVEKILETLPGFKIEVEAGPVRLDHLFLARVWTQGADPKAVAVMTYRRIIELAQQQNLQVDLQQAVK